MDKRIRRGCYNWCPTKADALRVGTEKKAFGAKVVAMPMESKLAAC